MKLRPYQTKWLRRVYAATGRVLIVGPTGAGKTVIAASVIRKAHKEGKRVLFLAHRRELVTQCVTRLHAAGVTSVGVIMAGAEPNPDAMVQVASIQTYARRDAQAFDVVFIDEAHHATAASYRKVIEDNPDAQLYGMTATPIRLDGKPLSDLFDSIAQSEFAPALIEQGALAKVRVWSHPAPDLRGVKRVGGDYDRAELGKRVKRKSVGDVIDHWVKFAECRPAVCFAVNVEHAKRAVAAFRKRGYRAGLVVADTPLDERARVISGLSTGETQVVVTVEVLTEGWDCPDAACCIMLRPTMSETLCRQMMGRAMRPTSKWPHSVILDHVGNTTRRQPIHPGEARDWSEALEPKERREPGNGETRLKECPDCSSSVWFGARTCAFCDHVFWEREPPEEVTGWLQEVTRDVLAEAIGAYKAGKTTYEIGATLGVSATTVSNWLKTANVATRSSAKGTDELRAMARELYAAKKTTTEIGKILGVSNRTIRDWLKASGIKTRHAKRIPDDLKQKVIDWTRKCGDLNEAARRFGISKTTLSGWCKAAGVATRDRRRKSNDIKQKAVAWVRKHGSAIEAARHFAVSSGSVKNWCKAAGFKCTERGPNGRWIPPKDLKSE